MIQEDFANTATVDMAADGSSKKKERGGVRSKPLWDIKSDGFGKTKIELIAGQFETVSYLVPRGGGFNSQREDFSFQSKAGGAHSASETQELSSIH